MPTPTDQGIGHASSGPDAGWASGATGGRARRSARLRRSLGLTRDLPAIGLDLDGDELRLLCLRRNAAISASGRTSLTPGTARGGRLRVVDPAIDALATIRAHLRIPARARLVQLVQPRSVDVIGGAIVSSVEADELAARRHLARAAGFTDAVLDPVPAALDRLVGRAPSPRYAEAAGWRLYRDGDHVEVERSERFLDGVVIGGSPVDREPIADPAPISVDRGVELLEPWPLLLGAAMAAGAGHEPGAIDEVAMASVGAWSVERIDGLELGGLR